MFVIFEGLDKTGKTTLINEIAKKTTYEYILRDRGPAGYIAYDRIYNRKQKDEARLKRYENDALSLWRTNDYIVIYCKTKWEIVEKRLKDHKEECDYDYKEAQKIYTDVIKAAYPQAKVYTLDTSNKDIDTCVKIVLSQIKKAEEKRIEFIKERIRSKFFEILGGLNEAAEEPEEVFANDEEVSKYIRELTENDIAIVNYGEDSFAITAPDVGLGFECHFDEKLDSYLVNVFGYYDQYKDTFEDIYFKISEDDIYDVPEYILDDTIEGLEALDSLLYFKDLRVIKVNLKDSKIKGNKKVNYKFKLDEEE